MLTPELVLRLKTLAQKYETPGFITGDPSQFMHRYSAAADREAAAFIAANLSFGKRELFISKLNLMFADIDSGGGECPVSEWLLGGRYKKFFPKSKNKEKFYRFFSYADLNALCGRLAEIIRLHGSLGEAVRLQKAALEIGNAVSGVSRAQSAARQVPPNILRAERNAASLSDAKPRELLLVRALISLFPGIKCVSQNPAGACKKLHMFLRWMVRRNSPVDLGLWKWASPKELLIPLDVHVMQESARLGLLPENANASAKTAVLLTRQAAQIWPDDPVRADFALFGLGVSLLRVQ